MNLYSILQGLIVGLSLIIAIGPQNSFLIRQGIKREHVFLSALICSLADIVLIGVGVGGVGAFFSSHHLLTELAKWLGIAFLCGYAMFSFRSAKKPKVLKNNMLVGATDEKKEIAMILLALCFLNPHAYLDAMVLLGSISAQHEGYDRYLFGLGAMIASFIWFFTITYCAKCLTPIFKQPKAWRILDIIIGCTMLLVAFSLLFE